MNSFCTIFRKQLIYFGLFFLLIFLMGCGGSPEDTAEDKVVQVEDAEEAVDWLGDDDEEKMVEKPYYLMVNRGKLSPDNEVIHHDIEVSSASDIDTSLLAWEASGNPLFLNCHGGLVAAKEAFSRPYSDGLHASLEVANLFPYYLIYDAGMGQMLLKEFEDIWKKIKNILSGRIFRILSAKFKNLVSKKMYGSDLSPVSNRSYQNKDMDIAALSEWLENEGFTADIDWQDEELQLTEEEAKAFSIDVKSTILEDFNRTATQKKAVGLNDRHKIMEKRRLVGFLNKINFGQVAINSILRFASKRDHGILLTLFEEYLLSGKLSTRLAKGLPFIIQKLVKIVWGNSKENVAEGFTSGENAAGSILVNKLADKKGEVVLMGSSTGAIYVCEIIKKMKAIKRVRPNAFKDLKLKVILVVAACKFTLFQETFENSEDLIAKDNVLVLSLSDEMELKGSKAKLPIGSTLYLVSAIAEKSFLTHDVPILGMERFFIKKDALKLLLPEEKDAIEFAYDYLSYGQPDTRIVVSKQPHPFASYLEHHGTRHVNLVKDAKALLSMALFSLHGYNYQNDQLAETGNGNSDL